MPVIEYGNKKIDVDDEGFLVDMDAWNEDIARVLAERHGAGKLTSEKMDIVRFMRDYYRKFNSFPILGAVCKNVHQPGSCTYEQFPDPIKAWKIAGLPKPSTEVFALIKHKV